MWKLFIYLAPASSCVGNFIINFVSFLNLDIFGSKCAGQELTGNSFFVSDNIILSFNLPYKRIN